MERTPTKNGWVEVICGPMFSGKTEELIRRVRRVKIANQRALVFKPWSDTRYADEAIVSHSEQEVRAHRVTDCRHIFKGSIIVGNPDVVAFDEAQFLGEELVEVVDRLANKGIRVIVAGLDTDFRGMPFGPMPTLMCRAEYVTKLQAICVRCGQPANRSLRTQGSDEQVQVGGKDSYEAVCRVCHRAANQPRECSSSTPPENTASTSQTDQTVSTSETEYSRIHQNRT